MKAEIMIDKEDQPLANHEINLVVQLLAETEITLQEIADRIQCPLSSVCAINGKYSVRDFRTRRAVWMTESKGVTVSPEPET
jgi:hypothetical protein